MQTSIVIKVIARKYEVPGFRLIAEWEVHISSKGYLLIKNNEKVGSKYISKDYYTYVIRYSLYVIFNFQETL